jgi:uncharacterized membrane protein
VTLIGASPASRLVGDVLPWLGVLVLAVLIGVAAIHFVRRWFTRDDEKPADFTLQQLRELHAAGNLTDEEFERAKSAVIGRTTADDGPSDQRGP